jgi:hypothetical protein
MSAPTSNLSQQHSRYQQLHSRGLVAGSKPGSKGRERPNKNESVLQKLLGDHTSQPVRLNHSAAGQQQGPDSPLGTWLHLLQVTNHHTNNGTRLRQGDCCKRHSGAVAATSCWTMYARSQLVHFLHTGLQLQADSTIQQLQLLHVSNCQFRTAQA